MAGSVWEPTGQEQLLLELLNAARAYPRGYGQTIGLDLCAVTASEPLAINLKLMEAARKHSQDMSDRNFFAHNNPSGQDPGDRIDAVGYNWKAYGESLAAGFDTPAEALRALIIDEGVSDLGHRLHLLAIDAISATLPEVGVGIVFDGTGQYNDYYSIETARDYSIASPHNAWLTGVVYNDLDNNEFYTPGEGFDGVTVRAMPTGGGADFSVTTFASGGYSLSLPAGTYDVSTNGGSFPSTVTTTVSIGQSNVKRDFLPEGATPGPTFGINPPGDELGVWNGNWFVDRNGNNASETTGSCDVSAQFGNVKFDVPTPFDWNGDGKNELAVFRRGKTLQVDANGNFRKDNKRIDTVIALGNGGDQAVLGNWDGEGPDDLGVLRDEDGMFHLDTNGDRILGASDARFALMPLVPGDRAMVGDWNGDGRDEVGIFRGGNTFFLDFNGDRTFDPAVDTQSTVSLVSARPATADYTGDGQTDIGAFSVDTFHFDSDGDGTLDTTLPFRSGLVPVPGNWV